MIKINIQLDIEEKLQKLPSKGNIGVPTGLTISRDSITSKQICDVMYIPYLSISPNVAGLFRYGKIKYRPAAFIEKANEYIELGSRFESESNEWGLKSISYEGSFVKNPKTLVIHVTFINHKIAFLLVHKDFAKSELYGCSLSQTSPLFQGDFDIPFPINADWSCLHGSFEYYQAMKSGKPVITPHLTERKQAGLSIHSDDYILVAGIGNFGNPGFTSSRSIKASPSLDTYVAQVKFNDNVHTMMTDFIMILEANGLIENGFVQPQISTQTVSSTTYSTETNKFSKKRSSTKPSLSEAESTDRLNRMKSLYEEEKKEKEKITEELINTRRMMEKYGIDSTFVEKTLKGIYSDNELNPHGKDMLNSFAYCFNSRIEQLFEYVESFYAESKVSPDTLPKSLKVIFEGKRIKIDAFIGGVFYISIVSRNEKDVIEYGIPFHEFFDVPELQDWWNDFSEHYDNMKHKNGFSEEFRLYWIEIIDAIRAIFKFQKKSLVGSVSVVTIFGDL